MMELKIADSRGRVNLGKEFANKVFLIEKTGETQVKLELAAVTPECEMWFHKNPEAQATVVRAIERLKTGQFADTPPDLDEEEPWMEELEG